jgi:hypothetical protein
MAMTERKSKIKLLMEESQSCSSLPYSDRRTPEFVITV